MERSHFSPRAWARFEPFILFLPTYATAAWYQHKLAPDLQSLTIDKLADEAVTTPTR